MSMSIATTTIKSYLVDAIKSVRSVLIGASVSEKDAYNAIVDFFAAFLSFMIFRQTFERLVLKRKMKTDEIMVMSLGYAISRFFQSALIKRFEFKPAEEVVIVNSYM